MKVGLYGDSYACLSLGNGTAWFENQLITKDYDLVSFAKNGSDITYSYKSFLENHEKFKKNIFIVTESTRHSFTVGPYKLHVSNIDTIDYIKNNINDFKVKTVLNSLKDHYLYSMSLELYDFGLAGMVESILSMRPDTIVVYGFYNHSISKLTDNSFYLSQVSMMELDQFGINFDYMKKTGAPEGRSAHLTDENNIVLAKYIKDKLDGVNRQIELSDFIVPTRADKVKYFKENV